ncbi:MAG: tetratricopeptide repeat protein [Bacteroidota bacterium]
MKKLIIFIVVIAMGVVACNNLNKKKMSITTSSETASQLYDEAMEAFRGVYMNEAQRLMTEALKEDPDFFMANYRLATLNLFFDNESKFVEYAKNAENCTAELSKGELLLKDAIGRLLENNKADLTDIGNKLVELYKKDVEAYLHLARFQRCIEDYEGMVSTINSAIEIAERTDYLYNMLGYAYMNLEQYDKAEVAFDKYIEISPNIPNPYDSKGDYYMEIEDYQKAHDNYIIAYRIDSLWSYKKAMKAKSIADSVSVK